MGKTKQIGTKGTKQIWGSVCADLFDFNEGINGNI